MGTSKLLLPWHGTTVIERLLSLLLDADLATVGVLIRADDRTLHSVLEDYRGKLLPEQSRKLRIVAADPPPAEMRDSVALLLRHVQNVESPLVRDAWMLVPADVVAVRAATIEMLVDRWRREPRGVLIPTHAGRRGHPTVFGWELTSELVKIPADRGINWLLQQPGIAVQELPVDDRGVLSDLDTPQDYAACRQNHD